MRISLNQKFNDAIKKDMRKEDENGRLYYNFSSHSPSGKPHKMIAVGEHVDFYDPKTGDKLYGKVLSYYTNGMVDIQVDGKKYKVRGYAPSMITLTEGIMDFSTFLSESSPACHEVLEESIDPTLVNAVKNQLHDALETVRFRLKMFNIAPHGTWYNTRDVTSDYNGDKIVFDMEVKYFGHRVGEWGLDKLAENAIKKAFADVKAKYPKIEMSYETSEKDWVSFFAKLNPNEAKKIVNAKNKEEAAKKLEMSGTGKGVVLNVIEEFKKSKHKGPSGLTWALVKPRYSPEDQSACLISGFGVWSKNEKTGVSTISQSSFKEIVKIAEKVERDKKLNPKGYIVHYELVSGQNIRIEAS